MKSLAAAVALCLIFTAGASAQQLRVPVTIDDLTAPTSPAFVLLDTSPASVERPENPKTFTVNLLNRLATSKGLPQNYALEVAPYWLASHPDLSFQQYQNPSIGQSILQSFSVSVATIPIPGATAGADPTGTRLGLGFRTHVWSGSPNSHVENRVADLVDVNERLLDVLKRQDDAQMRLEAARQTQSKLEKDPAITADDKKKAQEDLKKAEADVKQTEEEETLARNDARALALEIQGLDAERVGFFLTIAGGRVWGYPGDDVSRGQAEKSGVWFTPSYRLRACNDGNDLCETRVDVIGVVRALMEKDQDTRWDYGGRFVWRANKELHLSVEGIRRRDRAATGTTPMAEGSARTVGILEYRISSGLVLYGSFGRDFEKDNGVKPLVSYFGLNLGFGTQPVVFADKPTN